jgi:hypothetical protein
MRSLSPICFALLSLTATVASAQNPQVEIGVSIGDEPAGTITLELFQDTTPKTAENFRVLCSGEQGEDMPTPAARFTASSPAS